MNPSSTAGLYVLEYVIYVLIAIFFAWISAIAVKVFAPYACGSGIPEVCNCLSLFNSSSLLALIPQVICAVYNIVSCCFVTVLSNVSVISNGVSNVSIFIYCCGVVLSG